MTPPDWRVRVAIALDHTHAVGERGPRTFNARLRVAKALDGIGALRVEDVRWLERVAHAVASAPSPPLTYFHLPRPRRDARGLS